MKKIIFSILAFCLSLTLVAQTNDNNVVMVDTLTKRGCDLTIYDNGELANYAPGHTDLLTLTSSNPNTANNVQITFLLSDFDIHPSDTIYIYDGLTDADSLLLGALNNNVVITMSSDPVYTATVRNRSGALTLKFVSNADSLVGTGFIINTECVSPCQRVTVKLDPQNSSHHPHREADGFFYVDVCENDTLHMVAYGVYPDNNDSYHQSDATSVFTWDMSAAGVQSGVGLSEINQVFEVGRGYDVNITITDSLGCVSKMPEKFRVRTSHNPILKVAQLPGMCTGDPISVTSNYSNLSVIQVDSSFSEQLTTLTVTDTIFLPDGEPCNGSCSYTSSVTFTAFSPTATIQQASDILYVRVKMEHSYVGDIYIGLTCPNNQRAALLKKHTTGSSDCRNSIPSADVGWTITSGTSISAYLGDAYDYTDYSDECNPNSSQNSMGIPWNYCWSDNPQYGYAGGNGYVYESVNVHGGRCDSSNTVNMTNFYHPDGLFSSLIGCPMNGTWTLTIVDGYGGDNGWVTEWEMALDPALLPQDWSYSVHPDSMWISGPGADGASIVPTESGHVPYVAHIMDDLNCVYDTTFYIDVVERPHPDLGPDVAICYGELYHLDSHYDHPNSTYYWSTGARTPSIYLTAAGNYSVRVTTTNEDGLTCVGTDTVNVYVSPKPKPVFVASETEGCAPLSIQFKNTSFANDTMGLNYRWIVSDEDGNIVITSDKESPTLQFDDQGIYSVKLIVTTDESCSDSIKKTDYINVNYQPIAEYDALPEISLWSETNGTIVFQVQGDTTQFGEDMGFLWDFGDGNTDSSSYTPEHEYASWGDYDVTLSMFTPKGCNSSITHTVTLEADLVFPNVITPNDDGVNDVFAIGNLNTSMSEYDPDKYRSNELTIYDRWGKQVYHALNYDTFIDMTGERGNDINKGEQVFDASNVSDGTYYYTFYYKGKLKTIKYHGTLQVIRDK